MEPFESIREKAVALRTSLEAGRGQPLTGPELVQRACVERGYELIERDPDDGLLHMAEAVLDHELASIYIKKGLPPDEQAALVAHELGHLYLHEGAQCCESEEADVSMPEDHKTSVTASMEGYGARERRELQANVFGRELLLPRGLVRSLFLDRALRASHIAKELVLPADLVYQQLCDALLVPQTAPPVVQKATVKLGLNASQKEAAEFEGAPLLLEAGPGTGKTRTLVARIVHLVKGGADPGSILALTFSNKAAKELNDRVGEELPQSATAIWSGTFHAFGLELMRKYYQFFGLDPDVKMFSRADAIELLEEILPTLGLVYHQNLFEPALELKEMLSAISRAKDELVDAKGYEALAQAMLDAADSEETREKAERALEVAKVYAIYEHELRQRKVVDFGDLIMKPTLLLEAQPAVRAAVQIRHRHVLVDEYQDVNRASARLLKAVAGNGDRLWVVGDSRQSIYRFRGASSANMALFTKDFPLAKRLALETNYRSTEEVVQVFSSFSGSMRASQAALSLSLQSARGVSGKPVDASALPDVVGELSAVAARIQGLYQEGVSYRDQAILCRSNSRLNLFAQALEMRGVPVLYFGSLFEREEIRDMLALLSMAAENLGGGLMRVGQFSLYEIPLNDVSLFLNRVRKSESSALKALEELDAYSEEISAEGLAGLRRLAHDLEGTNLHKSPWTFLVHYLFERSDYLRNILAGTSIPDRMKCLALFQFLNFVRGQKGAAGMRPASRLLQKIRLLILLGEERHLSQIPTAALGLDAVRLMTIHGSKGLEFEAVHLPGLVATGFPMSYRPDRCPPPKGLLTLAVEAEEDDPVKELHEEEEECLFYVALSRAKTHLHLYRSRTSGPRNRSPSKFLERLRPAPLNVDVPDLMTLPDLEGPEEPIPLLEPAPEETRADQLEEYERCPRRYFYARVFGLAGSRKQTAFMKTHRCLYEVIDWVKRLEPGTVPDPAQIQEQLAERWKTSGPVDHGFETEYRKLAENLIGNLVSSQAQLTIAPSEPIHVQLTHGKVVLSPDQIVTTPEGGKVLRLIKTGRKGSFQGEDTIHGVYQLAAQQTFGPGGASVEVVHLTDRKQTAIAMTDRKCQTRVEKANEYLGEIKKGSFPTNTDPVQCPRCPYFFVCPTVPKGTLCHRRDREWPPGD